MQFNAFISYSHAADGNIGLALQKALTRLARPWFKLRALRIFRDETSLSASPHLWTNIEEGLKESEYFILLASPSAASSKWVQKEIAYWRENKSTENIILVLTEGEIAWQDKVGDFDWQLTNALPDILKGAFKMEPLYVDFRPFRRSDDLSLENPEFKKKAIYVAATLHNKLVEDLVSEDIDQHKRTIRIRNGAILVLGALLLTSIFTAWYAYRQFTIAKRERDQALSRLYFATALQKRDEQYDSAIFYAIKSYQTDPGAESKNGVYDIINYNRNIASYVYRNHDELNRIYAGKGNAAAITRKDGIDIIGINNNVAEIKKAIHFPDSAERIAVDPALEKAAFVSNNSVILWDLAKDKRIAELPREHTAVISSLAFNHSGNVLATADWDGNLIFWNLANPGKFFGPIKVPSKESGDPLARGVMSLTFSPNDSLLVTTDGDNSVILWSAIDGRQYGNPMMKHGVSAGQVFSGVHSAAFTSHGDFLATGGNDGQIIFWEVKSQQDVGKVINAGSPITYLLFDDQKGFLISGSWSGEIKFWNLATFSSFAGIDHLHKGEVTGIVQNPGGEGYISSGKDGISVSIDAFPSSDRIAEQYHHAALGAAPTARGHDGISLFPDILRKTELSSSGRLLASGSDEGVLVVWNADSKKELLRKKVFPEKVFSIEFDPSEQYVAAGGYSENLFLCDLQSHEAFQIKCGGTAIGAICFSKTSREIAVGTAAGSCYIIDLSEKKIKKVVQSGDQVIELIAFINDDKDLLTCSSGGTMRIIEGKSIIPVQEKLEGSEITINHAKSIIASRNENHIRLLKITGTKLSPLANLTIPEATVAGEGLFVDNEGTIVAATLGDKIGVYDIKTGELIAPMLSTGASGQSISMDSSGRRIAGDVSGNVQVWDLRFDDWIEKCWKITGFAKIPRD
jgi:WD40 repeat protein